MNESCVDECLEKCADYQLFKTDYDWLKKPLCNLFVKFSVTLEHYLERFSFGLSLDFMSFT